MRRQASFAFVLVSSCLTSAGCGTLHNMEDPEPAVYGGMRWELPMIREQGGAEFPTGPWAAVFYGLDLPLTLIGDTVTLPYTIPCSFWRLCKSSPSSPPPW
jgi:uncharacterized protein YceK